MPQDHTTRRDFLNRTAMTGTGLLVAGLGGAAIGKSPKKEEGQAEEVSPSEDLMREHGVLRRVLLVYGEGIRRIDANADLPADPILDSAKLIRSFIEEYHEKLEEGFLFPRFRQANKLVDLVEVLLAQHQAGRRLTELTQRFANAKSLRDAGEKRQLRDSMAQFIRMYNPHAAREDTVLFPAFRTIVTPDEYDSLGEDFEKKEHQLFGDEGFERMVDRVAGIEKALGIYELGQFTPRL